jgi:hypothetical protein
MSPTDVFALILTLVGILLLVHHYWSHNDDPDSLAQLESCACVCYFQLSDVSSHETWVVVCFTNAITMGASSFTHAPEITPAMLVAIFLVVVGLIILIDQHICDAKHPTLWHFKCAHVKNHETWILACFTNALTLGVTAPLLSFELK